MANFGLHNLVVVNGVSAQHPQAKEMASCAQAVLAATRQVQSLPDALEQCTFVLATTGKARARQPTLRPEEAAVRVLEEAARGPVAILFGREDHGLTADELRHAHAVMAIPTAPDYRALNLAQAVLLFAWEVFSLARDTNRTQLHQVSHSETGRCIGFDMRQRLGAELLAALRVLDIMNDGNTIPVTRSVERILALGPLQTRDARMLFTLARRITGDATLGPLPKSDAPPAL